MPALQDLTGQTFGKLKVLHRGPDIEDGGVMRVSWVCVCSDCLEMETVVARYLKRGQKKYCKSCKPPKVGKGHNGKRAYWGNLLDTAKPIKSDPS